MVYDVDFHNIANLPLIEIGLKTDAILCIINNDNDEINMIIESM